MKKIIYLSIFAIICLCASCGSSKTAQKTTEDKALLIVIKKFEKDPSNTELKNTITTLYSEAAKSHLDKIEVYNSLTEADKWIKIIREYEALNKLYQTVGTSAASKLINAQSYTSEIQSAKQSGAEAYYNIGISAMENDDKQSARNAYYAFKNANEFVPGYKDVRQQISIAYQNSIIKVVINPIRDNTFFYNSMGWNNYGNNYNNDYFQRSLVNDLGGNRNKNMLAQFYTDWEARRENIRPDWEVDLTWLYMNLPQPTTQQYSQNVSKQIEKIRDTSGKVQYQTVTATLHITKKYFNASADMELRITDVNTGRNITVNRYNEQFNWQEEYATYSGDSRALSGNENALLNNSNYRLPRNEDVVTEISRRIYPQIRNRIESVVNW
ncbi:MAG TPA: hypothetical protein VMY77_09630 [Chitinophagaceae bacterium]|nr:hypothetical protein [Chitinophagaceae bacterium]